jgi:uncharacterized protein YndB with AHSA1/START domain
VTEIRLDVELAHPPERVWRAVTDATVLADWFLSAELRPVVGHRFTINAVEPGGLAGFDQAIAAEVTELDAPRRLSMRWQAPELDAKVTISIARAAGGCRLTLRQTGFFGMHGLLRRRVLHRTYAELLGRRLPDALERLAVEDGRRGPVGAALARRRAQRARAVDRSGDRTGDRHGERVGEPACRRNAARPYRRAGIARRLRAVGRVRVSRPLHLEATVAFPIARRRRAAHGQDRPRRGVSHREKRSSGPKRDWHRSLLGGGPGGALGPALGAALGGALGAAFRVSQTVSTRLRVVGRVLLHGSGQADADPGTSRRVRAAAAGAGLLVTVGLVSLIVAGATALHPAAPPQIGDGPAGDPGYAELPGRKRPTELVPPSRSSAAAASVEPVSVAASMSVSPAMSPLTAVYRTEVLRLGGYRGLVTITNPSDEAVNGWTVVVTLQVLSLTVRSATGAQYKQDARTVTFTPKSDTQVVPARGSVRFTFEVNGVFFPTSCTVDGRACTGIPPS